MARTKKANKDGFFKAVGKGVVKEMFSIGGMALREMSYVGPYGKNLRECDKRKQRRRRKGRV